MPAVRRRRSRTRRSPRSSATSPPATARPATVPSAADPADRFRFFAWVADQLVAAACGPAARRRRRGPALGRRVDRRPPAVRGQRRALGARRRRRRRGGRPRARRPAAWRSPSASSCGPGVPCTSTSARSAEPEIGELIGRIIGSEPSPGLLDGSPIGPTAIRSSSRSSSPPAAATTCRRRSATSSCNASPASTAPTQQLLRVAAVIGRRVSYALLREVADLDAAAIDVGAARGGAAAS